jgi:RNA polymerase sigma-70 factor (ECF subfamily)
MSEQKKERSRKAWFDTTRWSLVVAAADSAAPDRARAIADLCRAYWPPVYAYVRSRGHGVDDAHDLTQEFFARLLEKQLIKGVRRERGRFRSFLLTAAKNFLVNEWERERSLKRGGGAQRLSLDVEAAEGRYRPHAGSGENPENVFEKRWAATVLERALERLEEEARANGTHERFLVLRPTLTEEGGATRYRELARRLDVSEGAVKVAIHRLRRRFGELLRAEVTDTVADPGTVDSELRYLFSVLDA